MSGSQTLGGNDVTRIGSKSDDTAGAPTHSDGRLPRGASIGRYVIIGWLGSGAMGTVYRCYDPSLDRHVALKLLRPSVAQSEDLRLRMVSESRAMARVKHVNVIAVYDAGEHNDQVFIAMELIAGHTLRQWIDHGPHPVREICTTFAQAADGLAAAHRAGLIHRDFKPDNVMLESDGDRVVVMDFGLARSSDAAASGSLNDAPIVDSGVSWDLTRTGTLVGTPAYMSPEQIAREPLTPASDQFSFCVALYEALAGERPFKAGTLAGLAVALRKGDVPPLPNSIPAHVRAAVARGLQVNPSERFAHMGDLSTILTQRPTGRRNLLAGGVLAVGCAVAIAGFVTRDDAANRCKRGAATIKNVWNQGSNDRVAAEYSKLGLAYTAQTWERAAARLDIYARAWSDTFAETCSASLVRGERSAELYDRQSACLTEARAELEVVLAGLEQADEGVARGAVDIVANLASPRACLDLTADDKTPALSKSQSDARLELKSLNLQSLAGHPQAAAEGARALLASDAARDDPEFRARVLNVLGRSQQDQGDATAAIETYEEALRQLAPAGGPRKIAVRIWTDLIATLATSALRADDAHARLLSIEFAAGGPEASDYDRVAISQLRAGVALNRERREDAVRYSEESLALIAETGLEAEFQEYALSTLSTAHLNAGSAREGVKYARLAVEEARKAVGELHPRVAKQLRLLASGCRALPDLDCAERSVLDAIAILEPFGKDAALDRASATFELGEIVAPRDPQRAKTLLEGALAVLERDLEPGDSRITAALVGIAKLVRGEADEGAWLERAEANARAGSETEDVANLLNRRGNLARNRGDQAEDALVLYQRAATLYASSGDGIGGCVPLLNVAEVLVDLERQSDAPHAARHALEVCNRKGSDGSKAFAHLALAKALAMSTSPQDLAAARTEAELAAAMLEAAGNVEEHANVAAWLAAL